MRLKSIGRAASELINFIAAYAAHRKFRNYTRLSAERFVLNYVLARRFAALDGAVVECGVWRGGMMAGMAQACGPHRDYYLLDSFEGLPPAKEEIDGKAAIDWQKSGKVNNCLTEERYAHEAMAKAGAKRAYVLKGWFKDTLGKIPRQPIAILRLDADWYDSTMECLDALYDLVPVGGVIIVDDYYDWVGCSRAIHDFLAKRQSTDRMREFYGRVAYLVKLAPDAK